MSQPDAFSAIRVVGGIVPPSLLGRVHGGQVKDPTTLAGSSYHLPGSETPRDAAARAWAYLRGAWTSWRAADADRFPPAPGTGPARERWLLILLRELGYGQVQAQASSLPVEGSDYPISHLWLHVPIHLLGPGVDLDRRNTGVVGAARAPQAMLQEFLNRSEEHLWGILSNGLRLRLLRDSTALAGSAYLEFDLEAMFDGELYAEFTLFWQLCHVSRLEKRAAKPTSDDGPPPPEPGPADCLLEAWRNESVEAGSRALDKLRGGVEGALLALGTGFLRHPDNAWLVETLRAGGLDGRDYHKALLRLVYRLLFCFVAEDREALLDPNAPPDAQRRYAAYFSTARLRRLSRRRAGGPHPDLWQAQRLVLRGLGSHGIPQIGVPALGGLFDPDARAATAPGQPHPDLLLGADMANHDFLAAIRQLAWVDLPGQRLQAVDYVHLGAEELGSVYESLLELIPRVDLDDLTFSLERLSGNERKTTGSYYTPPALVSALLDTALDPLLDDAVKNATDAADAEARLLTLTVCDPASGSGGFLVAAARRIARRVAQVRSGEDEPVPQEVRHALHDVIDRCIYGVDLNDLAAELAKVSLWLEALEPGKPLGFLDARVRVGNSLLGTTPALLATGVPDDAFMEIEGDDKQIAAAVRKRNKAESRGQDTFLFGDAVSDTSVLVARRRALLQPADDVDEARALARAWETYEESADLKARRQHADAWCAAFVWPLVSGAPEPPTDSVVRQLAEGSDGIPKRTLDEVSRLAEEHRFFHWHLEFPEVFGDLNAEDVGPDGWPGGFCCVLGNPPWERVKLQEQEFFAARDERIATAPTTAARRRLIAALATSEIEIEQLLHRDFLAERRRAEGQSALLRTSGRFPLNGRGDVNTYSVFAELFRSLTGPRGRAGVIVPTGIATDATTQYFFKDLVAKRSLVALYDFENAAPIFEAVHRSFKFCLLTMAGWRDQEEVATFAFFLHDAKDIGAREFALTPEEITLLNPNTGTVPIFRTRRDAEITLGIYRRVPVLLNENDPVGGNPWGVSLMTMFHLSNDSHLFRTREQLEGDGWSLHGNVFARSTPSSEIERMLPLYEAKMLGAYDHRSADVVKSQTAAKRQNQPRYLTDRDHQDPRRYVLPLAWISANQVPPRAERWFVGFSNVTSSTNERTVIAAALPASPVGNTYPLLFGADRASILALLNSLALDYCARQKVAGLHITNGHIHQLPAPSPQVLQRFGGLSGSARIADWMSVRTEELTYTAWDMRCLASDFGDDGPPFVWDQERRFLLRAELDAASFHLYGIARPDVDYILDTFPIVRRKDEAAYGEYRTKRVILEVFDAMQRAIDTGLPYQTILDPPPGHGARHPNGGGA